mmetsp:Transcript_95541/g.154117  ORF Transcript_95541/g.154117 Transcript_95541/m.154117 type:complete len:182 (+) Transcript_95541:2-547(+)
MVYNRWQSEVTSWENEADILRSSRSLRHLRAMTAFPEAYPVIQMGRAMSPDFDRTGCVSPIRDICGAFDGRATIPNAFRLATPLRSRREHTGAIPAYPPGKEAALGTSLRDRLATKAMYVSPPRVPNFVNASDRGSIEFAVMAVEAPLTAPKRSEFARFACASSKGGVFPRAFAGCLPWNP